MASAVLNAGVPALANHGPSYPDHKEAAKERKRHDPALEKYQNEKFEHEKERDAYREKMPRHREKSPKANIDIKTLDNNPERYHNVTEMHGKPTFDVLYTPSSKQKKAEEAVAIGTPIPVSGSTLYHLIR